MNIKDYKPWEKRSHFRKTQNQRINGERSDEIHAKNKIMQYYKENGNNVIKLKLNEYKKIIKNKHPDDVLMINNEIRVIEIRLAATNSYETSRRLSSQIDLLQRFVSLWINDTQTLILSISGNILKIDITKINNELKLKFENKPNTETMEKIAIGEAKSTTYYQSSTEVYSPIKAIFPGSIDSAIGILKYCIIDKEKKYKEIKEKKDLILINVHPILNISDYQKVPKNQLPKHSFKNIFIINGNECELLQ